MNPKSILEDLFARKARLDREIERLRGERAELDARIDAVLAHIARSEPLAPYSALAAPVEAEPRARPQPDFLKVMWEAPGAGISGWAALLYGADTPANRHRVRARLDFQMRRGRAARDGSGGWVLTKAGLAAAEGAEIAISNEDDDGGDESSAA